MLHYKQWGDLAQRDWIHDCLSTWLLNCAKFKECKLLKGIMGRGIKVVHINIIIVGVYNKVLLNICRVILKGKIVINILCVNT